MGFVAIKEDDLDREIREESVLTSQVEKKYWIIDSGCSHHMIGDMSKFVKFRNHDGGIVRVGNNVACHIIGTGSITLDGKTHTDDVYFFDGLKHNQLSVGLTNCNLVMTHVLSKTRKENYLVLEKKPEVMYFSYTLLK